MNMTRVSLVVLLTVVVLYMGVRVFAASDLFRRSDKRRRPSRCHRRKAPTSVWTSITASGWCCISIPRT